MKTGKTLRATAKWDFSAYNPALGNQRPKITRFFEKSAKRFAMNDLSQDHAHLVRLAVIHQRD